jgi:hypothetical protein
MIAYFLSDVASPPGPSSGRTSTGVPGVSLLMTVGVVLLLLTSPLVGPAEAQVYQRGGEQTPQERQFERGRSSPAQQPSTNLPDWAAPSSPEPGTNKDGVEKMVTPPSPPSNPSRIPVDGGLALLAAAGAGYAVRKLKGGEDDTDDAVA